MGGAEDGELSNPFICNHLFHNECLTATFSYVVLKDSLASAGIKCPFKGCNVMITERLVNYQLSDHSLQQRYDEYCLKAYVTKLRNVKWCPSPGCKYAIELVGSINKDIKCRCGKLFCFGCNNEAHSPCDCALYKKWALKIDSEAGSMDWIISNSKECPKCKQ